MASTGAGGRGPRAEGRRPRYATVILDVDSTLSGIEGIDWLARRRGGDLGARIAELTDRAMNGEIALDAVYGERLALVRPTAAELDALGEAYRAATSPGAVETIAALARAGVRVVVVSGGILHAILPLARMLGVPERDVHAVRVDVDARGEYAGFDVDSPLGKEGGKLVLLRALDLPRPRLGVGDGITDAEMKPALDTFALYTAFVRREVAARAADLEVSSFAEVLEHVLGSPPAPDA